MKRAHVDLHADPARFAGRRLPPGAAARILGRAERFVVTPHTLDGTPKEVLPDDESRGYLLIVNSTAGVVYADFGNAASDKSIPIVATGNFELFQVVPSNSVWLLGTGLVIVTTTIKTVS